MSFSKRPRPFCFVHELDWSEFKVGYRFMSEQLSLYYQIGLENVSVDAENYVGSFIAPKYELGCQVADLSGYVAKKAEQPSTEFSEKLASIFHEIKKAYILNELIWWNDPLRNAD